MMKAYKVVAEIAAQGKFMQSYLADEYFLEKFPIKNLFCGDHKSDEI